jgi:hypothetical protein
MDRPNHQNRFLLRCGTSALKLPLANAYACLYLGAEAHSIIVGTICQLPVSKIKIEVPAEYPKKKSVTVLCASSTYAQIH